MNLTASDIIMIMRRARKLGVKDISIGDVEISFFQKNRSIPKEPSISQTTIAASEVENAVIVEQQKIINEQSEKLEAFRKEQEEFMNEPVLDPLSWEENQANMATFPGEIEDAEGVHVQ